MRIDDKSVDIQLGSEKSQNSITAETGSSSVLSDNKINDSVEENNDNLVDVTTGNVENKVNDNDTLKYSLTEEIEKSRRFTVPEEYYSFFSRVGIDFEVAIEILASANTVCSLYVLVQIFGNSEIPQKLSWHSVGENDIRNNKTVLMKYELSKSLYAELFQAVRSNRVSIKGIGETKIKDVTYESFVTAYHDHTERKKQKASKPRKPKMPKVYKNTNYNSYSSYGSSSEKSGNLYTDFEYGLSDW